MCAAPRITIILLKVLVFDLLYVQYTDIRAKCTRRQLVAEYIEIYRERKGWEVTQTRVSGLLSCTGGAHEPGGGFVSKTGVYERRHHHRPKQLLAGRRPGLSLQTWSSKQIRPRAVQFERVFDCKLPV